MPRHDHAGYRRGTVRYSVTDGTVRRRPAACPGPLEPSGKLPAASSTVAGPLAAEPHWPSAADSSHRTGVTAVV
eukprot:765112-Hanusia_phi.AAC.1